MLRIFFSPIAPGSMKTWTIAGIFFCAIRLSTTVSVRDAPSRWIRFCPSCQTISAAGAFLSYCAGT